MAIETIDYNGYSDLLKSMGYANAVSIKGDLKAWENSGRNIIVDRTR